MAVLTDGAVEAQLAQAGACSVGLQHMKGSYGYICIQYIHLYMYSTYAVCTSLHAHIYTVYTSNLSKVGNQACFCGHAKIKVLDIAQDVRMFIKCNFFKIFSIDPQIRFLFAKTKTPKMLKQNLTFPHY